MFGMAKVGLRATCAARIVMAGVLLTVLVGVGIAGEQSDAPDGSDKVSHVFVIRRALDDQPLGSVRQIAHSALLLRTCSGRHYTLEYMGDSRAHLTEAEPQEFKRHEGDRYADIKMKGQKNGGGTAEFEWERQLRGRAIEPKSTPEELRELMQSLMSEYSLWKKEHCHTAQERVRRRLEIFD